MQLNHFWARLVALLVLVACTPTPVPIEQYDNLPPEREGEGGDRAYELPPGTAQMIA